MTTKPNQCKCDLCVKWYPLHRRIMKKLIGKDLMLFNSFLDKAEEDSDRASAAESKLDGSWPGFEWLPSAIKEHNQ